MTAAENFVGVAKDSVRPGALYLDAGPGAMPGFRITTPWGDVAEQGTQLEIRLEGELLRLRVRRNGDLELFFEVFNLLNRENDCCVERFGVIPQGNSYVLEPIIDSWLSIVPSFGIAFRWR